MARKREDKKKGISTPGMMECDLDSGYTSPIRSFHDFTFENLKSTLAGSRYVQLLLSLTVIGLILRFYNLGFNSLWLDEASTHTFAVMSIPEIWQETLGGEFNPPLFYWIEHVMLAFGNNEVVLRFFPALFGILTIPLVYLAGKEFIDRNVGIIAAAACTFSPFLIFYSQEARAYSMMLFFVAAALVFYFRALKTNNLKNWALFGAFSSLAFWSHFYAFVIISSLILYALILPFLKKEVTVEKFRMIGVAIGVFIVMSLPLVVATIQLFISRTSSGPTFGIQGLGIVSVTFKQLSGFSNIAIFSDIATYILVILFVIGIIQAFLMDKDKGIFLVLLTILAFLISFILSYKMPMVPRYLIFFAPVFFMGIALSYRFFYNLMSNKAIVYGFIAVFLLISAPFLVTYYSGFSKDDWRGFSGQMQQVTKTGDLVVLVPGYIAQPFDYYYSNRTDGTIEVGAYTADQIVGINNQKGNSTVYYIVTADIFSADPSGDAFTWLKENTRVAGQTGGIALFVSG
jgi:uncharacterized membrane protein